MEKNYLHLATVLMITFFVTQHIDAEENTIDPVLLSDHNSLGDGLPYIHDNLTGTYSTVLQLQSKRYGVELDDKFYSLVGFWLRAEHNDEYLYKFPITPKRVILHSTITSTNK
jgi:hypothetical protein